MHCLSTLPQARSDLWVHPEIHYSSASCMYPIHPPYHTGNTGKLHWHRTKAEHLHVVKMLRCLSTFPHPSGCWNTDKARAVSKRPQLAKTAADFIRLMTGAFRARAEHFAEHRSIFTCVCSLQTSLYEQAKQKWVPLSKKKKTERTEDLFFVSRQYKLVQGEKTDWYNQSAKRQCTSRVCSKGFVLQDLPFSCYHSQLYCKSGVLRLYCQKTEYTTT